MVGYIFQKKFSKFLIFFCETKEKMFFIFSSCPRTCTTFLVNCTKYIIEKYAIKNQVEQLSDANSYFHYKHHLDKHFIIKIESFMQTHHNIIPKDQKLVVHSSRNYKDSLDSLNKMMKDNNQKDMSLTEYSLQKYDEFCKNQADILFEYKDIRENKEKEIERLVAFFKANAIIQNSVDINISEIIHYADTKKLTWKNHKKW